MDANSQAIIVVGGGLVGATTALSLAQSASRTQVTLIDAAPAPAVSLPAGFDPRVVALNTASYNDLQRLGIWPQVSRHCAYQHMKVWDGQGTGSLSFSAADTHSHELGHIVENRLLVLALWRALEQLPNVRLLPHTRVEALQLADRQRSLGEVTLNSGETLAAPLILAADGAQSPLRQLAGIRTRHWSYGQTAIVTSVQTELPHQHTAWQRFDTQGPLAFLPLAEPSQCFSSIVWSLDEAAAQAVMTMDDPTFCQALGRAFEQRLGAVLHTDARVAIPLHQCHAVQYYLPGFALLGDAAHSIHPLAGQGVNLGLADARVLCAEIQRALVRGIPLGHSAILARYQRQRMGHNLAAMAAMEGLKRLFGQRSLGVGLLRNLGIQQVAQWPWLKQQFMRMAQGD